MLLYLSKRSRISRNVASLNILVHDVMNLLLITSKLILKKIKRYILHLERNPAAYNVKA